MRLITSIVVVLMLTGCVIPVDEYMRDQPSTPRAAADCPTKVTLVNGVWRHVPQC